MDGVSAPQQAAPLEFEPVPAWTMLDDTVQRFPNLPAIDFFGRRWSWAETCALAERAAAGLQRIGVGKGVAVGLCLPNTPYSVVMFYAILKAGGTVVNFNPLYTETQIGSQARDVGVRVMVATDLKMIQDKIGALAGQGAFDHVVICRFAAVLPALTGLAFRLFKRGEVARVPAQAPYLPFERLIAGAAQPADVVVDPARDIAVLQFTGGTTGLPKAAMLSHANIVANVRQVLASGLPVREGQERILGVLPLFHVFAMTGVMNLGVALGAELLLLPRPEMKPMLRLMRRRRPTLLLGVPTLFNAIGNAAEAKNLDLSFIKYGVSGGAAIAAEAAERFTRITGCQILEGYGLSETAPVLTLNPPGGARRGSVGQALPGTLIEIRDPEAPERRMPPGEKGEICAAGPQVMPGYHNQPEATAEAFVDGLLRTGDIGYLDADGYLFIVDRIKDLILCGGYNVYPRVIEEAAHQHPAVREAVAIGVPDAYRGQAPKLFVTLCPGATATGEEIRQMLRQHLNKIELPAEVEIRETLPKTLVGKLSKKELVAEEAAKHG